LINSRKRRRRKTKKNEEDKKTKDSKEASKDGKDGKDSKNTKDSKDSKDEKKNEKKFDQLYIDMLSPEKMEMVDGFSYQYYWDKHQHEVSNISPAYIRRLGVEYADLAKSLPVNPDSSVFMRVHESKMSFAQMIIIAPDGTPYGRGAFLFDMFFPPSVYPNGPPLVNLQTTGNGTVRFNPNLYNTGKVCLSLLGTWSGSKGESWNPKTSTFLQVAVSIQSLIFVPEPFFNEPGYEREMGTPQGKQHSDQYNGERQAATMKWAMIEQLRNPPRHFENVIKLHFYLQKDTIIRQCEEWSTQNSAARALLPQLKEELSKLKAPDSLKKK